MVLNRAAGLIKSIPPQDRTTSLLIQLHWLLGKVRLVLKLCVLTSQALILITSCPPHLRELLHEMQPSECIINKTHQPTSGLTLHDPQ